MRLIPFIFAIVFIPAPALPAASVGTNPPSLPLTAERINALPAAEQAVWHRYLAKSRALRVTDQALLADELKATGLQEAIVPPEARGGRIMPANESPAWYAGREARRQARVALGFGQDTQQKSDAGHGSRRCGALGGWGRRHGLLALTA
jgi:hypothetical protein